MDIFSESKLYIQTNLGSRKGLNEKYIAKNATSWLCVISLAEVFHRLHWSTVTGSLCRIRKVSTGRLICKTKPLSTDSLSLLGLNFLKKNDSDHYKKSSGHNLSMKNGVVLSVLKLANRLFGSHPSHDDHGKTINVIEKRFFCIQLPTKKGYSRNFFSFLSDYRFTGNRRYIM